MAGQVYDMSTVRDRGAAPTPSSPPAMPGQGSIDPTAALAMLAASSDVVILLDADMKVAWVGDAVTAQLGHRAEEVLGRSIIDFVHPDDLHRAATVIGLVLGGAFEHTPITAALYRVLKADGDYVSLEINGTPSVTGDGSILLVGRHGGDLILTDRLLEAVTADEPFDAQVDLVLALGSWRHPTDAYTVRYRDVDGTVVTRSSNLSPVLAGTVEVGGVTPWGAAVALGLDQVVEDLGALRSDSAVIGPTLVAEARAAGFVGCMASPVPDPLHPDGACITIWTTDEGPTLTGQRYVLTNMCRAMALVLQQRAQLALLERAARVDELTGLASRAAFLAALEREPVERDGSALLYVDLDGFKVVNDSFGHAAGDEVLRAAASRLTEVVPTGAVVGRLGGDEFAVLCPAGTDVEVAAALAAAIVAALAVPVPLATGTGVAVAIGASVGVAVGHAGRSPQSVLDDADRGLLAAKADGRGRWRVFTRG